MTIESQLQRELKARLVSFLLILCRDFGVKTDAGIKIDLKLSHGTLADLIHSHRPSVTRILIQLRQQQMISIEQQQITIHNPSILRQYFAVPSYSSTLRLRDSPLRRYPPLKELSRVDMLSVREHPSQSM